MTFTVGTQDKSVFLRRESEARGYSRSFDTVFKSAKGSIMVDADGREYIDFLAGCASLNYGHNDPDMKKALIDHIEQDGLAQGLDLFTTSKRAFLRSFERLILEPRELDYKIQFCGPTGTNAVEAAMKLARKITKRTNIIAFTNGYHGVSMGALAATGNKKNRVGAELGLSGVSRAAFDGYLGDGYDTADILEKMLSDPSGGIDEPAAIILEPVQGEGGLNAATAQWMRKIAAIAKRHGALLILDEIQSGCGRTGTFFAFETLGITPDLVTLSKSISGYGLPMALLLIKPEHDIWRPAEHNGTFRGNNPAFVTAAAALDAYWADGQMEKQTLARGEQVEQTLLAICAEEPTAQFRGRGLVWGMEFEDPARASAVCARAFELGLLLETSGPQSEVVKLLPPLTITPEELDEGLRTLARCVRETA